MSPAISRVWLLALLFFVPASRAAEQGVPVIDVLVVYTKPDQWNVFQLEEVIRREMADANTVLMNSHARARFRLVHSAKISYGMQANVEDKLLLTLPRLIALADGHLDAVHQLRDQYGADLVLFLLPMTGPGLAYPTTSAESGFGIVTTWEGHAFAKVLGRLLGCGPAPGSVEAPWEGPAAGIFSDSAAYVIHEPNRPFFSTIMSSWGSHAVFSNPRISLFGVPMGEAGISDNVRTIDVRAPLVAAFRGGVGQSIPPSFEWKSPVAGVVTEGTPVVLEIEPTIPANVQKVEFFTDQFTRWPQDPVNKTITAAPFRFALTNTVPAQHRWVARVTDRNGNVAQSDYEFRIAPAFDSFAQARRLGSPGESVRLQMGGLSREPGEPAAAANGLNGSAWFTWTAPHDGLISGEWIAEGFFENVLFGVYRGNALGSLVPVEGAASTNAMFAAPVRAGDEIKIALNIAVGPERDGKVGTLSVRYLPALANTSFATRQALSGSPLRISSHNVDPASLTNFTPNNPNWPIVWWKWSGPVSGLVRLTRPAWSRHHYVSASRGSDPVALESLGGLGPEFLETAFPVTAGEEIQLAATSAWTAGPGPFEFELELIPTGANHVFSQRHRLEDAPKISIPFSVPGPREPSTPAGPLEYVSWWEWIAPASGRIGILAGFQNVRLDVFTGTEELIAVAPAVTQPWEGRMFVDVEQGKAYQIAVSWPTMTDFRGYSFGQQWHLAYLEENDRFAKSRPLAGSDFEWQIPNSIGTREPGETVQAEGTLWFRWTAPADGRVKLSADRLDRFGSALLGGIFRGTSLADLTAVTTSVDYLNGRQFFVTAGTEYYLAIVAGLSEPSFATATLGLKLSGPPAHDSYNQRIHIKRTEQTFEGSSVATRVASDPFLTGAPVNSGTLWWSWTAPSDGLLRIVRYEGALGLFRESAPGVLEFLAEATPEYHRAVRAGETIEFMLAGADNARAYLALLPFDSNDDFADRAQLVIPGEIKFANSYSYGATREPREELSATNVAGRSRWWTFQVSSPSVAEVEVGGELLGVHLEQFRWDGAGEMDTVAWAQSTNGRVRFSFHAIPGVEYPFVVDAIGQEDGRYTVFVRLSSASGPPANDDFASAVNVVRPTYHVGGTMRAATAEGNEPAHAAQPAARSLWWRWTAPDSGPVQLWAMVDRTPVNDFPSTIHSDASEPARPRLVVYSGETLAELVSVATGVINPTNELKSELSFTANVGQTFYIALDTGSLDSSALDNFTLSLSQPASNDLFENRKVLSGSVAQITGITLGSTRDAGEWVVNPPSSPSNPNVMNVWYEWTAPADLNVTIRMRAENSGHIWAVWPSDRLLWWDPIRSTADRYFGWEDTRRDFQVRAGETYYIAVYGYPHNANLIDMELEGIGLPPNDHFANRAVISGEQVRVGLRGENASREMDEPPHGLGLIHLMYGRSTNSPSLWWSWTAPYSGSFVISSEQLHELPIPNNPWSEVARSDIYVYRGESINALALVVKTEPDQTSPPRGTKNVFLTAEAGVTYQIALCPHFLPQRVFDTEKYFVHLSIDPLVPNHNLQNAIELAGLNASMTGNLRTAPDGLWWRWTAPQTGPVAFNAQVHEGPLDKAAVSISAAGPSGEQSHVTAASTDQRGRLQTLFHATAGTTYYFHFHRHFTWSHEQDLIIGQDHIFSAGLSMALTAQNNDHFEARSILQSPSLTLYGDLTAATVQPGEPPHNGKVAARSLWWEWTVPHSGRWSLSAAAMRWSGLLVGLYRGDTFASLVPLQTAQGAFRDTLYFNATGGEKLKIALACLGTPEFPFEAAINEAPFPGNDNFADAQVLNANFTLWDVSNFGGSTEPGEPGLPAATSFPPASVWYRWTPSETRDFDLTVSDQMHFVWWGPPQVTIFRGSSLSTLALVAENRLGLDLVRNLDFHANAGEPHYIRVMTSLADAGVFRMALAPVNRPANDDFSSRSTITGTQLGFDTTVATVQADEPNGPVFVEKTLWWKWIAPATGWTVIDTSGSTFDTRLAVYTGNSLSTLTRVVANDDEFAPVGPSAGTSRVGFTAQQGTEYQIQLGGFGSGRGQLALLAPTAQPLPDPYIANLSVGAVRHLLLHGTRGQSAWIQYSFDLVEWHWGEMIRFEQDEQTWTDPSPDFSPYRFYKLVFLSP